MKNALEALSQAQKAGAPVYARNEYEKAQLAYDSAMANWSKENERFFLFRDYSQVKNWTELVLVRAEEAQQLSDKRTKSTEIRLKDALLQLEKQAAIFESYYKKMPLSPSILNAYNNGRLKLSESKIAFENKRFSEAEVNYEQARKLINTAGNKAETVMQNWFNSHENWQKQAKQAVQLSANKKVILVDKLAHKCIVYHNKKAIKTFDVEFGANWMGDKVRKGDKATPEGMYLISDKKKGANTKFYKALLINYPNDEDRRNFEAAKRKGLLPAGADIGGLIEFHGLGGKGVDWTDGCIALKNDDMDALFKLVSVGTPVVIVGSIRPLETVIKDSFQKQ